MDGPEICQSHCFHSPGPRPGAFQLSMATSTRPVSQLHIWVLLWPSQCQPQGLRDSGPAPVISSRPQGGLGFSKDPSNVPQNEPNFWVGLKSYLLPLRGPALGPRCWTPATSGCLRMVGYPPRMSQIAKEHAITSSLCLCQLFFKKTQPTNWFPPLYLRTLGHEGQDYSGAGERGGYPTCENQPERNPEPLASLETTYLLPLLPVPFPYLVGYRKKPAPWLCQLKRVF